MPSAPLKPAKLLIVDDDPTIIQAIAQSLVGMGTLRFATGGQDALRMIQSDCPDLLLLDAQMPDLNGLEVLRLLREQQKTKDLQVIMVTSQSDERTEMAALELGAADFLAKPVRPPILLARVRTQLRLKQALDELRARATLDGLTGCANRTVLIESMEREWARSLRERQGFSLLLIDVDFFKRYNDRYGHVAGDHALVEVAKVLRACANRPGDLVSRYGGEEFAVLLSGTDRGGAGAVAAHIRNQLAKRDVAHADGVKGRLSVSVGCATFDAQSAGWVLDSTGPVPGGTSWTSERLLNRADQALYTAKANGRDQAVLFSIDLNADEPDPAEPAAPSPA